MNEKRLADRVLHAFELALEQGDVEIADHLNKALEMSLTRKAGGKMFEERREFSAACEAAQLRFQQMRERA